MNIKMPKRDSKISELIEAIKAVIKNRNVTTKKGQIARALIIFTITMTLFIALTVIISNMKSTDTFSSPDNTKSKYLNEKNSSKIKETYNTSENKDKFLILVKDMEIRIVNHYINNITKTNSEAVVFEKLNTEFKQKNWKTIDMKEPSQWIGEWSVDKTGAIKFKFLNKQMEPDWMNDQDVSKYIIKN